MRIFSDMLGALFFIGLLIWGVLVYAAPAEEKSIAACKPVHHLVSLGGPIHRLIYRAVHKRDAPEGEFPWQDWTRLNCLKAVDFVIGPNQV